MECAIPVSRFKTVLYRSTDARFTMDVLHVREDGNFEFTDGKLLIRVQGEAATVFGPWKPPRSFLVRGRVARKIAQDAKANTNADVDLDKLTISYNDREGNRITLINAIVPEDDARFPPTDDIVKAYAEQKALRTGFSTELMGKLMIGLKKLGCEHVIFDWSGDSTDGFRFTAKTLAFVRICGVIMPVSVDKVDV